MYFHFQNGVRTAQKWMKEVGLPAHYGAEEEPLLEIPALESENKLGRFDSPKSKQDEKEYKRSWCESLRDLPAYDLLVRKFYQQVERFLSNAQHSIHRQGKGQNCLQPVCPQRRQQ